jgi:hypothetical protein
MTQYLLAVHYVDGEGATPSEDLEAAYRDVDALNQILMDAGKWVFAGGLHEPSTATVVRVKDGETMITDGPFAEAKEQIGGFWILECADLDEALDWAAKASVACRAPVEVRPFQDDPAS